jgi:hypothetical protein
MISSYDSFLKRKKRKKRKKERKKENGWDNNRSRI